MECRFDNGLLLEYNTETFRFASFLSISEKEIIALK